MNLHEKLGLVAIQLRVESIHLLEETLHKLISELCKSYFAKRYAHVFNRLHRSKNHKVYSNFKVTLISRQVKARKAPIHIQDKVAGKIKTLVENFHNEKLDKCTTDNFIAPIVLTAKKDNSIKIALNSKAMNAKIWNNKHQMPNIHERIDSVAQIITKDVPGKVWFTSLDLKNALVSCL